MKSLRQIATLEDALYELIHHSRMPAKAQAEALGVSYSRLVNCTVESAEFAYHHTRWLIPQTRMTGNFMALDYLEDAVGRVAIPIPNQLDLFRNGCAPDALRQDGLQLAKELGDVARAIEEGLKDKRWTVSDALRSEKELTDLIRTAATTRAAIRQWREYQEPSCP